MHIDVIEIVLPFRFVYAYLSVIRFYCALILDFDNSIGPHGIAESPSLSNTTGRSHPIIQQIINSDTLLTSQFPYEVHRPPISLFPQNCPAMISHFLEIIVIVVFTTAQHCFVEESMIMYLTDGSRAELFAVGSVLGWTEAGLGSNLKKILGLNRV